MTEENKNDLKNFFKIMNNVVFGKTEKEIMTIKLVIKLFNLYYAFYNLTLIVVLYY